MGVNKNAERRIKTLHVPLMAQDENQISMVCSFSYAEYDAVRALSIACLHCRDGTYATQMMTLCHERAEFVQLPMF